MSTENINNVENQNQKAINEADLYSEAVQILEIESNKLELYKKAKELLEQIPHYKNAQKLLADCDVKIESIRRQMAEKRAKKSKIIRNIIIAAVVLVIGILAVSAVASANSQTQKDFESAMNILASAQEKDAKGEKADNTYNSAYSNLTELGTYKDAGLIVMQSYVDRIEKYADDAEYTKAQELYAKATVAAAVKYATPEMLPDAEAYIYNAILNDANTRYDSQDYNNALDLYKLLDQDDPTIIEKMDGCKFNGVSTSKVGSTVKYGSYEIDGVVCSFEDSIDWIVIAKEGNKYLLITKNVIDVRAFNKQATTVTWAESSIRNWLNGEFVEIAFSDSEFAKINTTKNGESEDKVFLLSAEEVGKYITEDIALGYPTAYAAYKKPHLNEIDGDTCRGWWLRDTSGSYDASIVDENGDVRQDGYQVNDAFVGVRPAIWVTVG